jgi:REP element-mobilizing transposase RayT
MMELLFNFREFPLAYLITIRSFGTWLHGDERLAVDRHGFNVYGRHRRPANAKLEQLMKANMACEQVVFNGQQCEIISQAIKEVCDHRKYDLLATNVRTNHVHAVVSAQSKPEMIADAFKSYSTRRLREAGLLRRDLRPWARGRSRRYLWKPEHVSRAIHYVLYEQGEIIPEFDDY